MTVQIVDPPPKRSSGRGARYSDQDLQDFAAAVQSGQWVWDGEPAPSETAAYQRARNAIEKMCEASGLDPIAVKPRTYKDPDNEDQYRWLIGPRSEPEQTRIRDKSETSEAEAAA